MTTAKLFVTLKHGILKCYNTFKNTTSLWCFFSFPFKHYNIYYVK